MLFVNRLSLKQRIQESRGWVWLLAKLHSITHWKEFLLPVPATFGSAFWAPREEFFHQETNNVPTELEIEIPPWVFRFLVPLDQWENNGVIILTAVKGESLDYVWLCNFVDCSPPGSSVHGILQARLESVAISSPGDLPHSRGWIWVSCTAGGLYCWSHQGSPLTGVVDPNYQGTQSCC